MDGDDDLYSDIPAGDHSTEQRVAAQVDNSARVVELEAQLELEKSKVRSEMSCVHSRAWDGPRRLSSSRRFRTLQTRGIRSHQRTPVHPVHVWCGAMPRGQVSDEPAVTKHQGMKILNRAWHHLSQTVR